MLKAVALAGILVAVTFTTVYPPVTQASTGLPADGACAYPAAVVMVTAAIPCDVPIKQCSAWKRRGRCNGGGVEYVRICKLCMVDCHSGDRECRQTFTETQCR